MSRLIAYMGSDPERLQAALHDHRELLVSGVPPKPEGLTGDPVLSWGVGFYQGGEVLLQRRPRVPLTPVDLLPAIKDLRTDVFLAQVLPPLSGKTAKNENTPPYRFRSWIMAHRGSTPAFDRVREEVLRQTPDFLRRNIRGQTESEHIFHLFLACLHEAGRGQMEDPNLPPELALKALSAALSRLGGILQKANVTPGGPMQVALTNGRSLIVLRSGAEPVWVLRLQPKAAASADQGSHGDHFRGVVVVAGLDQEARSAAVADREARSAAGSDREAQGAVVSGREAQAPPAGPQLDEVPADHAVLVGRDLAPRIVSAA